MQIRVIRKSHPRRGSLYMTVVITAAIVSLLAMSSLMVQRLQRKAYASQSDQVEARLNAETAGRLGLQKMKDNQNWRFEFPNGDWQTDTAFGNGTFTINVVDPIDGDLTDSPTDPIVISGIGRVGNAVQRIQFSVTTSVDYTPAVGSTMHAGNDLKLFSSVLSGSGLVTTNDDAVLNASSMSHDVSVADALFGSGYNGSTSSGDPIIDMPTDVFSFYTDNGTQMTISDIVTGPAPPIPAPLLPPNKISNGDFESGVAPWGPWPGGSGSYTVVQSATAAYNGNYGCAVKGRSQTWEGAHIDVTSIVQNGVPYDFQYWFRSATACKVSVTLKIQATVSGTTYVNDSWDPVGTSWTQLTQTMVPSWSGSLTSAECYIESDNLADYDLDGFRMMEPSEGASPTGPNLLLVGDMEASPLSHWYSNGATIDTSTVAHNGSAQAIKCTSRTSLDDTLAQDITSSISNGATYHAEGWVRYSSNRSTCRLALKLKTIAAEVIVGLTPWREGPGNTYVRCYGQQTVSWTGDLEFAELFVQNQDNANDTLRLDNAAMIEVAAEPPPAHTIYRAVLSPNNNPYGPTNSNGIYVVDCLNQDIYIRDSRIVGTLVLLNPGPNSQLLEGGIDWAPAKSNFPSLLVDGTYFKFSGGTSGLNETLLDKNFNPSGTPSPYVGGVSDSDISDTWVSSIKGLMYSTNRFTMTGTPVIDGNIIAVEDIILNAADAVVTDSAIPRLNPPPGFMANPVVELIDKSIRRVFDE